MNTTLELITDVVQGQSWYMEAANALPLPVLVIDSGCTILFANDAVCNELQLTEKNLVGQSFRLFCPYKCNTPECYCISGTGNGQAISQNGIYINSLPYKITIKQISKGIDGSDIFLVSFTSQHEVKSLQSDLQETTLKYLYERRFRDSLFAETLYSFEVNLSQNSVLKAKRKYPSFIPKDIDKSYSNLIYQTKKHLIDHTHANSFSQLFRAEHLLSQFRKGNSEHRFECRCKNSDGQFQWVECMVIVFQPAQSNDIFMHILVHNIEEKKREELDLHNKAKKDFLTGLLNRASAVSAITSALHEAKATQTQCALMMIDMDKFKQLNDTFGHSFGDSVLVEVAKHIQSIFRKGDIVGRIGGDEFIVCMCHLKNTQIAHERMKSLCALIGQISDIRETPCSLSISVGVSFSPQDGSRFEDLYEKADAALYHAKKTPGSRFSLYSQILD